MSARNLAVPFMVLSACAAAVPGPATPSSNPLLPYAFSVNLELATLALTVQPPTTKDSGPSRRFLGEGEVELALSSLRLEPLGGRTRVLAQLAVRNLTAGRLTASPSALSPAGTSGLLAVAVEVSGGGTAGLRFNGDGRAGGGGPHDFVSGKPCAGKGFCARWVQLPAPLEPEGSTEALTVDLEVPAEATTVQLKLALLGRAEAALASPGSLRGEVRLRSGAPAPQAEVALVPAGLRTGAALDGSFRFAAVGPGVQTVVATAPGCGRGEQAAVVASGAEASALLVLDCDARAGRVSGRATRGGVAVPGLELAVLPAGSATPVRAVTDAEGRYLAERVPLGATGSGQVFISRLVPGLRAAPAIAYQDLPADGEAVIDFTLEALPPPSLYTLTQRWGPVTAGKVTLVSTLDLSQLNSPLREGVAPEKLAGAQVNLNYDPTRLTFFEGESAPGSGLDLSAFNGSVPGVVRMIGATVTPTSGVVPLFAITFEVRPGPATSVTSRTTIVELAASSSGDRRLPIDTRVQEDTLVLP